MVLQGATSSRILISILTVLLTVFFMSCSHKTPRQQAPAERVEPSNDQIIGPTLPPSVGQTTESQQDGFGPEPLPGPQVPPEFKQVEDDGYVLILGPGLAHTLSFLGALKEFERQHIKIKALIGVESGAVIAALYSVRGLNGLEWQLTKWSKKTFFDLPLIRFSSSLAQGKQLDKFLESSLKGKTFDDAKIPLFVAVHDVENKELKLISKGSLPEVLRSAVANPNLMEPAKIEGDFYTASTNSDPIPLKFARSLSLGKVIVFDALGDGLAPPSSDSLEMKVSQLMKEAASAAAGSLRDADGVVRINVSHISFLDYEARADLAYRGKTAAAEWISQMQKSESTK